MFLDPVTANQLGASILGKLLLNQKNFSVFGVNISDRAASGASCKRVNV